MNFNLNKAKGLNKNHFTMNHIMNSLCTTIAFKYIINFFLIQNKRQEKKHYIEKYSLTRFNECRDCSE